MVQVLHINLEVVPQLFTLKGGCISDTALRFGVAALPAAQQKSRRFLTCHLELLVLGSFPFLYFTCIPNVRYLKELGCNSTNTGRILIFDITANNME